MSIEVIQGDALEVLSGMKTESIHTVCTSPPYWGLRDFGTRAWEGGDSECAHKVRNNPQIASSTLRGGKKTVAQSQEGYKEICARCGARRVDKQLGLEKTPAAYVDQLVQVFQEVRRVLRDDGTLWLVLGDSYSGSGKGIGSGHGKAVITDNDMAKTDWSQAGLKRKQLCMIPARAALALQADGWWLRSDIIWEKANAMPESVTDRPTKSYEHIFLLTKSPTYFWDGDSIREPFVYPDREYRRETEYHKTFGLLKSGNRTTGGLHNGRKRYGDASKGRNVRDVWTIPTEPFSESHFAVFPQALVERCIKAGTSEKGCCPKCGSPWIRVVKKSAASHKAETHSAYPSGSSVGRLALLRQAARIAGAEYCAAKKTVGWQPSCNCVGCGDIDFGGMDVTNSYPTPIPCTVLDCFVGSGTTLLVAQRLGRNAIGIELNPKYCDMARKRTSQIYLHEAETSAAPCGEE